MGAIVRACLCRSCGSASVGGATGMWSLFGGCAWPARPPLPAASPPRGGRNWRSAASSPRRGELGAGECRWCDRDGVSAWQLCVAGAPPLPAASPPRGGENWRSAASLLGGGELGAGECRWCGRDVVSAWRLWEAGAPPSACGISPLAGGEKLEVCGVSPWRGEKNWRSAASPPGGGRKLEVCGVSPWRGEKIEGLRGLPLAGEEIWVLWRLSLAGGGNWGRAAVFCGCSGWFGLPAGAAALAAFGAGGGGGEQGLGGAESAAELVVARFAADDAAEGGPEAG